MTIDGQTVLQHQLATGEPFRLAVPTAGLTPGPHQLEVDASYFMLPHDIHGNNDYRPLVFQHLGVCVGATNARQAA